jgi:methionyl-tRNA synthetase
MKQNNFYISTSIAYANAAPHLGFALESIITDCIARYKRMNKKDVFFLTGTDEHGIKIYKTAKDKGLSAKELCDNNVVKFQELSQLLHIANNDFIRTSDSQRHWPTAQKIWKQLDENSDIYKKSYTGNYCEGCERFMQEKELIDGLCPHHKKPLSKVSEENYFFRLSKYSDQILKKIESKEIEIIPEFRQNEILSMLKEDGLKDVSFSRPKENLPWGIPVPNDESQVMYVWCDALTNYISALDYSQNSNNYQKYWKESERVHVIGKDIVRFHAGIWIGMLFSADIPLPNKIIIHGFLTTEGKKMSKSLGNVIDPFLEVEKYGVDAIRYFLLSQIPLGQDYDFKREQFENIYNAHLANNLGNLVNRVHTLCTKHGITPDMIQDTPAISQTFKIRLKESFKNYHGYMEKHEPHKALEEVCHILDFANKQMDELKPWIAVKEKPESLKDILPPFLELLRQLTILIAPFIPETTQKIRLVLGLKDRDLYFTDIEWNEEKNHWKELGERVILFPRLD